MRYFYLSHAVNNDEPYPQASCSALWGGQVTSWKYPDERTISKLNVRLDSDALLSDFISEASILADGFIISKRVSEIIENFTMMEHRSYDLAVRHGAKQFKDYRWLHLCQPELARHLDYGRSKFQETHFGEIVGPVSFESFEHYNSIKANDDDASYGAEIERIAFIRNAVKRMDVFTVLPFSNGTLVSEVVMDALIASEISGMAFEPGPEVSF